MECTRSDQPGANWDDTSPQPHTNDISLSRLTHGHPAASENTKQSPQRSQLAKTSPPLGSATMSHSSMSVSKWTKSSWETSTGLSSIANSPVDVKYESGWHQSASVEPTRTRRFSDTGTVLAGTDGFKERPSQQPERTRKRLSRRLKEAVRDFFTKRSDADADIAYIEDVDWTELRGVSEEHH
ncbi:MAG: hypothetical protein M1831_001281 [Alyxoria varia]|nr:MAG: hypothetical protein M1831_001281 [Alyxoria varia]